MCISSPPWLLHKYFHDDGYIFCSHRYFDFHFPKGVYPFFFFFCLDWGRELVFVTFLKQFFTFSIRCILPLALEFFPILVTFSKTQKMLSPPTLTIIFVSIWISPVLMQKSLVDLPVKYSCFSISGELRLFLNLSFC